MPLRNADLSKTRKFEDGDAWLVLREQLSKHDRDVIAECQQNLRVDPRLWVGDPEADERVELRARIVDGNRTLFSLLAIDWSHGGQPTAEAYDALDAESGSWVDECVGAIIAEANRRAEKNAGSSSKPEGSPDSSPAEPSPPPTDSPETNAK